MKQRIFNPLAVGLGFTLVTLGALGSGESGVLAQPGPEWHNCLTREVFTPEKRAWCDRWQTLQNGTYTVPIESGPDPEYTTVTLENGEYTSAERDFTVALANEPGWLTFGDIQGNGVEDAALIFGVAQGKGTTLTTYLTTVLDIDSAPQALAPVRLGERIVLNAPLTIDNSRIIVPQLTQTEIINRSFVIEGSELSELAQLPTPEQMMGNIPDSTLIFSQTPGYAVRVFTADSQLRINLFNRATGTTELTAAPAVAESSVDGVTYSTLGAANVPVVSVQVAPSGAQTIAINGQVVEDAAQVTGTVTYQNRMALPPNAVIEVTLVDVSRAGAPAVVLASQTQIAGGRQVPIPFELVYDPTQIDPRYTYAVQARITVEGQLRYITTTQQWVITRGRPNQLEVMVEPVSR